MADSNYTGLNDVSGPYPKDYPGPDKPSELKTVTETKKKPPKIKGDGKPKRARVVWSCIHSHVYVALMTIYVSVIISSLYGLSNLENAVVNEPPNGTTTVMPKKEKLKLYGKIYGSYASHVIAFIGAMSALIFNDVQYLSKVTSPMLTFTILIFSSLVSITGTVLLSILAMGPDQTQWQLDNVYGTYSFSARGAAYCSLTATFICLVECVLSFFFPARRSVKYEDDYDGELMPELPPQQVEVVKKEEKEAKTKKKDKKDTDTKLNSKNKSNSVISTVNTYNNNTSTTNLNTPIASKRISERTETQVTLGQT